MAGEPGHLDKASISSLIDDLMVLAPHLEIAHHIPGRVRLAILPSGVEIVQKTGLNDMIGSIPGITKMRINAFARSIVIEYDREKLPYDLWESLPGLLKRPDHAAEIRNRLEALWD